MDDDQAEREPTLRLLFQFDGPEISLLEIRGSAARPMPAQAVSLERPRDFWYELHDEKDRALFRRAESNPLLAGVEHLTGESERPFLRELPEDRRGRFLLTVPAIEANSVVLFGVTPEDAEPRELGEFAIRPAIAGP